MIKEIHIKNFQSHEYTKIELHDNINVITGLSDSGKSGFIRAIDAVVRKRPFYLKYGTKSGCISLKKDSTKISRTFEKVNLQKCPICKEKLSKDTQVCTSCGEFVPVNSASDYYDVDGVVYEKFGSKIPDYLADKIRINPVLFLDKEVFINLARQHDDFFFIGSQYDNLRNKMIASLIADSEKVDILLKELASDKLSKNESLKLCKADYIEYSNKIETSEQNYSECELLLEQIEQDQLEIDKLQTNVDRLRSFKTMIDELKSASACVQIIKNIVEKVSKAIGIIDKLLDVQSQHENLNKFKQGLKLLSVFDKIEFSPMDSNIMLDILEATQHAQSYISVKKINNALYILNKVSNLNLQEFDVKTDIDDVVDLHKKTISIMSMRADITKSEDEINSSVIILNKCKLLHDKINKEICDAIDESICPITKEKYCDSCVEVLKRDYSA